MTTLLTTPRTALGGLLALALAPALWPGDAAAHTCDDPFSTDLIAGQSIDAGDVKVCNDATKLTVTYEATFPWCLLETNLHVATIPTPPAKPDDNIPQNRNGNPKPDEFAYGDAHDCVGTATFEIPLADVGDNDGVEPGDTIAIAAHAEVENGAREEGAWGKGTRFVERGNWAMYFTYEVQEPFLCGGETSKCVFVTSTTHNGNLDGLAGADQICRNLAESAGSLAAPGTYKAWLSTAAAWPADGTRFTQASVPYKLVTGTTVAPNWSGLVDGLLARINRSERAAQFTGFVWTGTSDEGTPTGLDCRGWLDGGRSALGAAGCADFAPGGWSACSGVPCGESSPLYCFQQ